MKKKNKKKKKKPPLNYKYMYDTYVLNTIYYIQVDFLTYTTSFIKYGPGASGFFYVFSK